MLHAVHVPWLGHGGSLVVDSVSYGSGDARHVVSRAYLQHTIACMRRGLAFLSEEYGNISIIRIGKLKVDKKVRTRNNHRK